MIIWSSMHNPSRFRYWAWRGIHRFYCGVWCITRFVGKPGKASEKKNENLRERDKKCSQNFNNSSFRRDRIFETLSRLLRKFFGNFKKTSIFFIRFYAKCSTIWHNVNNTLYLRHNLSVMLYNVFYMDLKLNYKYVKSYFNRPSLKIVFRCAWFIVAHRYEINSSLNLTFSTCHLQQWSSHRQYINF